MFLLSADVRSNLSLLSRVNLLLIPRILIQIKRYYIKEFVFLASFGGVVHALVSTFLLNYFSGTVGESPIWIPAGIGLGVLIISGCRYWPFIFIGAMVGEIGGGHDVMMALKLAGGAVIGMLVAASSLKYFLKFNPNLESVGQYLRLLLASLIAASISATINTNFLVWGNLLPPENLSSVFTKWLTGDFFGMAFITPVLLVLHGAWYATWTKQKLLYLIASILVAFLLGQAVFFGWFKEYVDLTGRGNLYIFLLVFIGLYFGRQGAMLVFAILLIQAVLGSFSDSGFIGINMMTKPGASPAWLYLGIACAVGLVVGVIVENSNRKNDALLASGKILEKSEERFREIVANTPALMATYDLQTEVTDYVNPFFTKVLGYVSDDFLVPNAWWEIAYPDPIYRQEVQTEWSRRAEESRKTGAPFLAYETRTTCKDNSVKLISWGSYFAGSRMVIYGVDVTGQRHAEEVLKVTSAVYRAMGEAVVISDAKGHILMANDAFYELTGFSSQELTGKLFAELLVKQHGARSYSDIYTSLEAMGRWEGQAWIAKKHGKEMLKFISIYSTFDDDGIPLQRVILISEVTDQRKARELINQQANFDPLTGLPNRRLMFDRLDQLIKQSTRSKRSIAIIYIDLDNFKDVNDSRGHDFGDQLLKGIATRLRSEVRETDTVARIGGDEFVILLGDLEKPEVADLIVRQISKKLADPILIEQQMIYTTASLGISLYPNDGSDGKVLLLNADQAMYAAKAQGRNSFQYFTQSLQVNASYRAGIVAELRVALEKSQFELVYQPIVNLRTGLISHAEALLRWRRSNGEIVLPSAFIQIAEDSGVIVDIGDWVWQESLSFMSALSHSPQFSLAINVSASQFNSNQHSATRWLELLTEYQVSPQSIVLEITERMMLNQSQRVMRKITMFQEAGCKFSVDDFGTGYSSLASLKNFNFDYIKIDADFVRPLSPGSQDAALVFAMVSMAKGLSLESIAEGVETHEQADILRTMSCTYAQGYLFSKPLAAAEFKILLESQNLDS